MKYTNLEIFGSFTHIEQINEFNLVTLFNNFNILKQNPLYSEFLEEYNFDENGISPELLSDIVTLICNNDAMLINNKQALYFTLDNNLVDNIVNNIPNKNIYRSFVDDYRNLLIEKEKSKHI